MVSGKRLQNEEFHTLYRSPNIVRVINPRRLRWAGHVDRMVGVPSKFSTGKIPLGRPSRRLEDNIKLHLKEICIITRNWVDSTQNWVDSTHNWVDSTQNWVGSTQNWVDSTQNWVDSTQNWVESTQNWVDSTQNWDY